MANTGKRRPLSSVIERAETIKVLHALSDEQRQRVLLSANEACGLLVCSVRTMERARQEQRKAKNEGRKPDPMDESSIPFETRGTVVYSAKDVMDFLDRITASQASPPSASRAPEASRGLQSWMASASPLDTWPFSLQPDGRPIGLHEAILSGRLTGACERLTLREFAEKTADAAAKGYSNDEREQLTHASRISTSKKMPPSPRRRKSGGPI